MVVKLVRVESLLVDCRSSSRNPPTTSIEPVTLNQYWTCIVTKFCLLQVNRSQHCVKSVRIRSFSGPYFPVFSPNTETKVNKDQKNSEYEHSSRSATYLSADSYEILLPYFFTTLNNDSKITMGAYLQYLNPYHAIGHILYPMKTSESLWFKDVFRG